jgi:hypothetical protein
MMRNARISFAVATVGGGSSAETCMIRAIKSCVSGSVLLRAK